MPQPQSERTACRYKLIEQLVADGIGYMFGNPGTVEEGFLDAISAFPQFQYVLALQEGAAVGIADGYARARHRPAVVQLHSGVGLSNGTSLLYQAMRGHSPLVVLAGEAGLPYDAFEAQNHANLVDIARPFVKYAARVVHAGSVLRTLRRAIKVAATPPMGPTFVALPLDVLDAVCTESVVPTSLPDTRVAPDAATIASMCDALAGARRPMFVVGDGVAFSRAQPELTRLAELVGAQVWGADSSEINFPTDHPLYGGLLGHMFGEDSRRILCDADVVLVCGTYLLPEVFPSLDGTFAPTTKILCVDLDAYEMGKNAPFTTGVVADPKLTLCALAAAIDTRADDGLRARAGQRLRDAAAAGTARRAQEATVDQARASAVPLAASTFAKALAERLPADAIVIDEAITSSGDLCRYLLPRAPGNYFQTRGGSLGIGLPGAIGAKLAHPERTVVGFAGDGGALYTFQALWSAAHHGIGAKFVVCNNRSYRILKLNIEHYWRERGLPSRSYPTGFDIRGPEIRFDALAQALGVAAVRVESSSEIPAALDAMFKDQRPFLVDLVIDGAVAA